MDVSWPLDSEIQTNILGIKGEYTWRSISNKYIWYLYRALQQCKEGYHIGSNLVQDEKGDLFTVAHSVGNRRKSPFCQLLNVFLCGINNIIAANLLKWVQGTRNCRDDNQANMPEWFYTVDILWLFSFLSVVYWHKLKEFALSWCFSRLCSVIQCSFHVLLPVPKLFFSTLNNVK
jgi:hypothetical protein